MSLFNLIGSVATAAMNKKATEQAQAQQFEYNRFLQTMQNDFTESMWNKTNEYNSPLNQLSLYEAAGINPNVAIGAMSGNTAANSVQGGSASGVDAPVPGIPDFGSALLDSMVTDAQVENLQADTEKKEAETRLTGTTESWLGLLNDANIREIESRISKNASDSGFSEARTREITEMLPILKNLNQSQITEIEEKCRNYQKERDMLDSQMKEIQEKIRLYKSEEAKNYSSVELNRTMEGLAQEQTITEQGKQVLQDLEAQEKDIQNKRNEVTRRFEQQMYHYGFNPHQSFADNILWISGQKIGGKKVSVSNNIVPEYNNTPFPGHPGTHRKSYISKRSTFNPFH